MASSRALGRLRQTAPDPAVRAMRLSRIVELTLEKKKKNGARRSGAPSN